MAAYVVSGDITVEQENGVKRHFTAGEVIPETVNTLHRGTVGDQPAEFIVFYAASKICLSQRKEVSWQTGGRPSLAFETRSRFSRISRKRPLIAS